MLFLMLNRTEPYVEKIHCVDAELAGYVHKLEVKLQRLCGSGLSLFAVRILAKPYYFGVNWPTTLWENKDGPHFFILKFECHNTYDKLLLCTSENGYIASGSKTIQNGVFVFFFKEKRPVCFQENQKLGFKRKPRLVVFSKKRFFQPWLSFNPFFLIFPWSHHLE